MAPTTSTMQTAPLTLDPQIDERGHGWAEYHLDPQHAVTIARQLIAKLRTNRHALARVHAAATAAAGSPSSDAVAVLAQMLTTATIETDAQTLEDFGHDLLKAHETVTSPEAIDQATRPLGADMGRAS